MQWLCNEVGQFRLLVAFAHDSVESTLTMVMPHTLALYKALSTARVLVLLISADAEKARKPCCSR